MPNTPLDRVPAAPVKSFFVHMLTRDISLPDAILDLLDNCVDGIQRSETLRKLKTKKPYTGYWAKLTFSGKSFCIEDNCGGIPWEDHDKAFRMGRLKKDIDAGRRTVGTYGIGMKRAIFKIGSDCIVTTHSNDLSYQVEFSSEWMRNESVWDLTATEISRAKQQHLGTRIEIKTIKEDIAAILASDQFEKQFREAVATHYAYIIDKGFRVIVNDRPVEPRTVRLLFADGKSSAEKHPIRPFIYEATEGGVEVFLAVGFTSPIPSKEEADDSLENYQERYTSAQAGWTVICNDRTVLYCDKTPLTGWGLSGVPQYHPQFIAISGIVLFSADDASKLPTTTTKRGIDASSTLYLHVREKMIEGMKIFTQYTNQWKGKDLVAESKRRMKDIERVDLEGLRRQASALSFSATKGVIKGKQYRPALPRPTQTRTTERISFERPVQQIQKVSRHLFDGADKEPKIVGEKCFDVILEEAGQ